MSRPYGVPKTEEERRATHEELYGSSGLPPRGSGQSNPSVLNRIATMIGTRLIQFINLVFLANREYNMDDYESATTTASYQHYTVGENNIRTGGTQKKLFVSKSTLIFCTANTYVRFNSSANVIHILLANTWYEFKHNIRSIDYAYVTSTGVIYIHCEGVLPEEARIGA